MKTKADKSEIFLKAIKCSIVFLICLILFLIFGIRDEETQFDSVRFLDVGQGDSILITSEGHSALIDTSTGSQCQSIVTKLRNYGVDNLDALIITHPHSDHIGSAAYILSKIGADNVICSGSIPIDENDLYEYSAMCERVKEKAIPFFTAEKGMEIKIGNFTLTVLSSDETAKEENDRSVVIMARNGKAKFLLMGDAETPTEKNLLKNNINVSCDVIKIGHHGGKDASSEEFLKAAKPEYAVVSVGENDFGHPAPETLVRIINNGATVMRTDQMGDISFSVIENRVIPQR